MNTQTVRVAAVQEAPVFLDREKTVEKACERIHTAGEAGAHLVVFPEAFVSGYPDWVWVVPNGNGRMLDELYSELLASAVSIPDEATDALCDAAKAASVTVTIGIHERNAEASGATLYNTLLTIGADGRILGKHRKLMPTGGERLVWGQGDGSTLPVFETPMGRLGGLLCWENYMPLARQAMYAGGTQIYVAPTWDSSEAWLIAMRHIAREGGMFVVNVCQAVRMDDIPDRYEFKGLYSGDQEWINSGNSCIVNPQGEIMAGPLHQEQGMLYADLDLSLIPKAKRMFDVAGHYARPDVFHYEVRRNDD